MYLDRSTALNKATIKRLIINNLVKLYRDTRITQQACTLTAKTTPFRTVINPAQIVIPKSVRKRLLNYTAGPLGVIALIICTPNKLRQLHNTQIAL